MHRHERHGQQIRDPVLAERQEDEHDEEVKVHLDVAAGEVHEDGRGAHQPEADGRRAHGAAGPLPAREQREERHDAALGDRVQDRRVVEERAERELPPAPEDGADQRDHSRVGPRERHEEAEAGAPDLLGQGTTGRDEVPQTFAERGEGHGAPLLMRRQCRDGRDKIPATCASPSAPVHADWMISARPARTNTIRFGSPR